MFVWGIPYHSGDGSCCIGNWSKILDDNIKITLLNMMVLFFFSFFLSFSFSLSPCVCVLVVAPVCFTDYQFTTNQDLHFSINEKI